jgi:uncharacterized protein (TIGR02588 family)
MTRPSSTNERVPHAVRTGPEWVTFSVSALILTIVVILLVVNAFHTEDPAAPVADRPGSARQVGGQYFVPVEIVNRGDLGAAQVQVIAELTIDGNTTSGDQVIDFLGGGEIQELTFAFADDPADGKLVIIVAGFAKP